MKEFISGISMLLILSVFLVQFTVNQGTHNKLLFAQNDITVSLQQVKQEGFFSDEIKADLTQRLMNDLHLSSDSGISIYSGITSPVGRGELIDYSISVEVDNIVGTATFLGISGDENKAKKTFSGYVSSEYVG